MANTNIINAVFGSGVCAVTTSAFRANYGMVLRFSGIDLPTAFECDFSNYDVSGKDSITAIGQNGEVQIPDDLWESGLNIYAYVYLHPTDDSGVTVYTVTIPVLGRPNRTEEQPTPHEQSVIEQAISALNDAVEQTAADVETTTANAQAASQSEANAATSERSAAALAGAALASQNAAESASQSATESASGAAESARNAAQSASQAAESATNAQESAEQAERSAQSISGEAERAERAATTATEKAATASAKATEAAQSASSAASAAQNAASSASSAQSSASGANTAKTAAQTAQTAAEQAKDDAVSAADRAEQAEQEVLSAMDGTYEDLTSGNAQQLLSTVTEANSVPYLFRPTASNADRAYLDELVGGTVAWNQLVDETESKTDHGITTTFSNGVFNFSGTATSTYAIVANAGSEGNLIQKDHVCLSLADTSNIPEGVTLYRRVAYGSITSGNGSPNGIFKSTVEGTKYYQYRIAGTVAGTAYSGSFTIQCFDLTKMLGSTIADYIYTLEQGTAGAGVAYFRKLFPKPYYAYNSGELLSVKTSAHKMTGFNQWDEAWELGTLAWATGANATSTTRIRSKNYIPCIGDTAYYVRIPTSAVYPFYYDADKNFISYLSNSKANATFTTPSNARYIRFFTASDAYGTTYNNDICINIHWDGERDGEYEAYQSWNYPLDSDLELRGIPKLDANNKLYYDGDTYAPDGTVTRKYGIVDLGTLTWIKAKSENHFYTTNIPAYKMAQNTKMICAIYDFDGYGMSVNGYYPTKDNAFRYYYSPESTAHELYVTDSTRYASMDAAAFKAAMSGVMLVYELATPTTETADPYRHLQICDPNGTEEFVSTSIVPVGHNTRYPENLRAKIEGLPWNFNSIIAMTETTTTASKAYSVGDYFILNNVLYRVTSAIASGGTITIGTNCRATTIMDEIKALS